MKETQLLTLIIKNREITLLRKKYDPSYSKDIPTHLNLVYKFSGIDQSKLFSHIKKYLKDIKPFEIKFDRFWKFKKNSYIYIFPDDVGLKKLMIIHKKLSSGILKKFKNKEMPRYVPHITLTHFDSIKDSNVFFKKLKNKKINFQIKFDSVQLLTQDENYKIKSIKNFKLK